MGTQTTAVASSVGYDARAEFLAAQRLHDCTDCGYPYLDLTDSSLPGVSSELHGYGTVVRAPGPLREVHILPHCGTELPEDLLRAVRPEQYGDLAVLVHDNVDLGTGAIYRRLVDQIRSGEAEGVAVAGFHLSRLLIDANRASVDKQVPRLPYVGSPEMYAGYLERHGERLRVEGLLPWLDAVDGLLQDLGDGVAYHHHTYDVFSMSPRPYDKAYTQKRPAFQLVWRRPASDESFDDDESVTDFGLADREDIELICNNISDFFEKRLGVADGRGNVDYPLLLPVVPFLGTRRGDPAGAPAHIMYDVRKDLLGSDEAIQRWVLERPWHIGAKKDAALPAGR